MKGIYPVIFTQTKDCVLIEVPDMEILTEGKNMTDAIEMARDAIGLKGISLEDAGSPLPISSEMKEIDVSKGVFAKEGESFVSLVDIDFGIYRRKVDNKMVRRNVTLPNWLNLAAEKEGINVSKVLQDALIEKFGMKPKMY